MWELFFSCLVTFTVQKNACKILSKIRHGNDFIIVIKKCFKINTVYPYNSGHKQ